MYHRNTRRAATAIGTIAAATALLATTPAYSTTLASSHVTAHPTDRTPASGQTFRVKGAVWSGGERVAATIHVKTWRDGHWVQLKGAVMHTNRDNRYSMRVILEMKGERRLRVVGDPDSATISTARKTFSVTVH